MLKVNQYFPIASQRQQKQVLQESLTPSSIGEEQLHQSLFINVFKVKNKDRRKLKIKQLNQKLEQILSEQQNKQEYYEHQLSILKTYISYNDKICQQNKHEIAKMKNQMNDLNKDIQKISKVMIQVQGGEYYRKFDNSLEKKKNQLAFNQQKQRKKNSLIKGKMFPKQKSNHKMN